MAVPAPTPSDMVSRFIAMLPDLPSTLPVFVPSGGVAEITVLSAEGDHVAMYAPDELSKVGTRIEAQLRNDDGDGYDVLLHVQGSFFQGGDRVLVHASVADVVTRSGVRSAPRAQLAGVGRVRVVFSSVLAIGDEFQVRLADASTTGIAFITDALPAVGDRLAVAVDLGVRNVMLEALVAHVDPAPFGRNRIGCEIRVEHEQDRQALAEISAQSSDRSSEDARRPELGDAMSQTRSISSALHQRLKAPRSDS